MGVRSPADVVALWPVRGRGLVGRREPCLWALQCCFEHADQIRQSPSAPRATTLRPEDDREVMHWVAANFRISASSTAMPLPAQATYAAGMPSSSQVDRQA